MNSLLVFPSAQEKKQEKIILKQKRAIPFRETPFFSNTFCAEPSSSVEPRVPRWKPHTIEVKPADVVFVPVPVSTRHLRSSYCWDSRRLSHFSRQYPWDWRELSNLIFQYPWGSWGLSFKLSVPLGLVRTQSFQLLYLFELAMIQSFQLLVPWDLRVLRHLSYWHHWESRWLRHFGSWYPSDLKPGGVREGLWPAIIVIITTHDLQ